MTGRAESWARIRLDSPWFWIGLAYIGILCVVVWSLFLNRNIAHEQAFRAAQQQSSNASAVSQCYASVDNGPSVAGIIAAVRLNISNNILSTQAALRTDPDGQLTGVRRASIVRQRRARNALDTFRNQIIANTKTETQCDRLANRLNVQPREKVKPE